MCRLVAYVGGPLTLEALLLGPEHSLLRQCWEPGQQRHGTVNADGFGAGWYDLDRRPEPARYRTTRPMWADRSFASMAGVVASGAVLAAVRSATPPLPVEESSAPPFTAGPWLFAHNGAVDGFQDGLASRLRRGLSERRDAQIEGASDAEVLFAMALDRLDAGASAAECLASVVTTVLAATTARLNLVLHDGHTVTATACGNSLYVLEGAGLAAAGVIVASEPLDRDPGWRPVPDGSLVQARPGAVTLAPLAGPKPGSFFRRRGPNPASSPAAGPQPHPAPSSPSNLRIDVHLDAQDLRRALAADARAGLVAVPKELPPKWFYDERGCQLFDAITRLPEYYPTRSERAILEAECGSIAGLAAADTLVELGSGTSEKTRVLLDALAATGRLRRFVPLDVSEATLASAGGAIAREYPGVEVHAVVGDLERHVGVVPDGDHRLFAFLGGTIGNLPPRRRAGLLSQIRRVARPGETLLLGTDLVKDVGRLEAAYDDQAGVTAEFNRNVLRVLNRELDADFVPERFTHVARFDPDHEWVEMLLRSTVDQTATMRRLELEVAFAAGEEMRTEISAKFRPEGVERELAAAGFELLRWWTDPGGDFGLSLARAG